MSDALHTEAESVADLAQAAAEPKSLDPTVPQAFVVPEGAAVKLPDLEQWLPDLEQWLPAPRRKVGVYKPATVDSLTDYLTLHEDPDHTSVWIDQSSSRIVAVVNDHAAANSGWGDHRADLQLLKTPEWTHWLSKDGHRVSQEDFAEHLQDGIGQIRDPDAATMLEIAQTIQGKTNVDWKSATRLDNGEIGFAYQEEVKATAGRSGQLEIPQELTLAVSPFYGEAPFELTARLRYRMREGNLTIGYKLNQPRDVVLAVLKGIAERLGGKFAHVYMGTPRA